MLIAVYDDFFNELTEQLRIEVIKEVRPCIQYFHQFPRLGDGAIAIGDKQAFLFQLCDTELFGQLITLGYKNVRINEALLFQRGQHLILTGQIGYLFVEFNDVRAP